MKQLLYFFLPAVLATGCMNREDNDTISTDLVKNPLSASEGGKSAEDLPVMTFEKDHYDFGKVKQGEKVVHVYKFRNTGESDLIISTASASCGCTVPEYPKEPIGPGKKGEITVVFSTENKTGVQNKTVTIIANTIPNSKELVLTGEILEPEKKSINNN